MPDSTTFEPSSSSEFQFPGTCELEVCSKQFYDCMTDGTCSAAFQCISNAVLNGKCDDGSCIAPCEEAFEFADGSESHAIFSAFASCESFCHGLGGTSYLLPNFGIGTTPPNTICELSFCRAEMDACFDNAVCGNIAQCIITAENAGQCDDESCHPVCFTSSGYLTAGAETQAIVNEAIACEYECFDMIDDFIQEYDLYIPGADDVVGQCEANICACEFAPCLNDAQCFVTWSCVQILL
jgi:hypothetical protein